jgi:hypothetical protein
MTVDASEQLLVSFGLNDPLTAVKTVRTDVVTTMNFTGRRLKRQMRRFERAVGTVHTALGWGFFILLNSHDGLLTCNLPN